MLAFYYEDEWHQGCGDETCNGTASATCRGVSASEEGQGGLTGAVFVLFRDTAGHAWSIQKEPRHAVSRETAACLESSVGCPAPEQAPAQLGQTSFDTFCMVALLVLRGRQAKLAVQPLVCDLIAKGASA